MFTEDRDHLQYKPYTITYCIANAQGDAKHQILHLEWMGHPVMNKVLKDVLDDNVITSAIGSVNGID